MYAIGVDHRFYYSTSTATWDRLYVLTTNLSPTSILSISEFVKLYLNPQPYSARDNTDSFHTRTATNKHRHLSLTAQYLPIFLYPFLWPNSSSLNTHRALYTDMNHATTTDQKSHRIDTSSECQCLGRQTLLVMSGGRDHSRQATSGVIASKPSLTTCNIMTLL